MSLSTLVRIGARRGRLAGLMLVLALGIGAPPMVSAQQAPTSDWWSAIRRDDLSTVQGLLLRHTDPNAFNTLGNPALTQAARDQSWKVFDALRAAPGVQIDAPNARDETALMYLCILGQTDRARTLIAAGAQINRLGWTPLHYAASKAQMETARMLIERGAIINAPGPDGTTPLMMAALSGKPEIVRLLLEHGADPTMFNAAHETAADWARKNNHASLADGLDQVAAQRAQGRQGGAAGAASAGAAPAQAPSAAASPASGRGAEDASSFSRYFDLGRFEDTAPGK
ncbi:ankyrin repeat domain-containing protein [Castellaniella hirudinis]|uniref:Ankyrin repeat domain-containing protein n=1 Tax=Castellaniella hirudinis TaxID=1144617 RepID=A0ABV8RZ35_9BURK